MTEKMYIDGEYKEITPERMQRMMVCLKKGICKSYAEAYHKTDSGCLESWL